MAPAPANGMGYPVSYYCPHCEAVVELERDGYLADKAVTPRPFEGWEYVSPDDDVEAADGVVFTCGDESVMREAGAGCGERFYLSFVKFADGEELDPRRPERVELAEGGGPATPDSPDGPRGPSGSGGFY